MFKLLRKIFKNSRVNFLTGIMVGIVIAASGVYAATLVNSKNVTYNNANSTLSSTNVQDALDELYKKSTSNLLYSIIRKKAVLDSEASTYVTSSSGIDFTKNSSAVNGKGVYIRDGTANNEYPIYYYRGKVSNEEILFNNVLFGGFCWKIVRTTETGGIKISYSGVSKNGICPLVSDSIGSSSFYEEHSSLADAGYMYGDIYESVSFQIDSTWPFGPGVTLFDGKYYIADASSGYQDGLNSSCNVKNQLCGDNYYYVYYISEQNVAYAIKLGDNGIEDIDTVLDKMFSNKNSSLIKQVVDSWYKTNIQNKGFSSYLEDAIWCYDRSIIEDSLSNVRSTIRFNAGTRFLERLGPKLTCSRKNDNLSVANGSLTYPVGLLTIDEAILAGAGSQNFRPFFAPLTMFFASAYDYGIAPQVSLISLGSYQSVDLAPFISYTWSSSKDVVPVVSLKNDTTVRSGDGSYRNPYVIG